VKRADDGDRSSVDRVYEALREKILSGVYPPGSRLILSRLANEHQMSFIPVREALQRLEGERMVRSERNRGATVTELSIADMRDIYETRLILEEAAIRAATSRIDERQLERAARALQGMRENFLQGDDRKAYAWHQDFHFALYEPAGSAWTLHLIGLLWTSAERYMRLAASVRPEAEEFVAEHAEILRAVKAGDADGAAERLADNLRTTARLLGDTYNVRAAPGG
jgi:GntR family carbon starvation induced transcriptional regulator